MKSKYLEERSKPRSKWRFFNKLKAFGTQIASDSTSRVAKVTNNTLVIAWKLKMDQTLFSGIVCLNLMFNLAHFFKQSMQLCFVSSRVSGFYSKE